MVRCRKSVNTIMSSIEVSYTSVF
ncbi:hypothetical protein TSAR_008695 [Trichomalopsis sarcophagae]|uniref:Uncharacterized protein n=1 Tax=Trichomalopsis sarcophagae TaxID=543379 RepID=A0A232F8T4_9HYME|nr:hypothetical protein TSAR_008695 [Trichomalopsis sarcophagae]